MSLPSNVSTGLVTGRFIVGVVDGPDADTEPDAIPAQGTITFTASVPYIPDPGANPPVTIVKVSIVGVLDNEGYLSTPQNERGVRLIATDDPDLLINEWTWNVSYKFDRVNGTLPAIPTHGLHVPSGGTVDLTTAIKVPSAPGVGRDQFSEFTQKAMELRGELLDAVDEVEQMTAAVVEPTMISQSFAGATTIAQLGTVNKWTVTAAATVTLPSTVKAGSTFMVWVSNIERVTWGGAGIQIVGGPVSPGEAWITLTREMVGWSILLPGGGGGLPVYLSTHPLFSPGSLQGDSLTAFNDFFGTSLTTSERNSLTVNQLFPYRYPPTGSGGGSLGVVWWNRIKAKWGYGNYPNASATAAQWLPTNNGTVTLPLARMATGAGMQLAVGTEYLPYLPPSDSRDAFVSQVSFPTAVKTPEDLASSILSPYHVVPVGSSVFVESLGRSATKKTADIWVDESGAQVFPVNGAMSVLGGVKYGTGSPEGVVAAPVGTEFVDVNATMGAVKWIKAAGGSGNTGWRVLFGDTGWVNLTGFAANASAQAGTPTTCRARRIGYEIYFHAEVETTAAWVGNSAVLTLPAWVIPNYAYPPSGYGNQQWWVGSGNQLMMGPNGGASPGRRTGLVSWPTPLTSTPWPSALPGA